MTNKISAEPVNHRTRVGMQRRERTRRKILEAALRVFARKGTDAAMIDDFIAEAGIARGTFYNHFRTTSELLQATVGWLSHDFVESITNDISGISDPLLRLATGIRIWLAKAEQDRPWAAFVARVDFIRELPFEPLRRDLSAGQQSGLFHFPDERVAFDLIAGTLIMAMHSYVQDKVPTDYTQHIVHIVLQGLGVDSLQIETALSHPLPAIQYPPLSLSC
ncbi:TetR/AcrR family transcriptional regulator [Rheinheimera muenzenbergensis]|uniref:TetR/AcrR family transcriptional regulator n=1 Tax=Rheinheimera muenzenbergensis TaxID=1193628 RepID=A0ABU8C1I1_9GAMM